MPLALALLIDTSSSMQSALDTAQEAAIGFVRQLAPADVASVISFASGVEIVQEFTSDGVALQNAIRRTRANGSTALYNAVYIALKQLNKTIRPDDSRNPSRRAIVVLSDGDDTSSLVSFDEIIDLASRADTIIYTIGLGRRDATLSSRKYQDGEVRATKTGSTDWRSVGLSTAREGAGRRVSRHPGGALEPVLAGLRIEHEASGRKVAADSRAGQAAGSNGSDPPRLLCTAEVAGGCRDSSGSYER